LFQIRRKQSILMHDRIKKLIFQDYPGSTFRSAGMASPRAILKRDSGLRAGLSAVRKRFA
jgi:hypothetical protein